MRIFGTKRPFSTLFAAVVTLILAFSLVPAANATTDVDADGKTLQFNNTVKIGQNAKVGFSHRYSNVISGVDAILTVTNVTNTRVSNIDRVSTVNNEELWTNLKIGSGGGLITYRVDFVEAGKRDPVVLKNFSVNVGDIDLKQFVQFTGPSSYTLATNSALTVQEGPATGIPAGAIRFSEPKGVGTNDSDTRYWAQVEFAQVSSVDITLGATIGGSALYRVSFGAASWSGTQAPPVTPTTTPEYTVSYDLNARGATGGGGSTSSSTEDANDPHTIAVNGFSLPDYTFVSWNTSPDGSGVSYDPNDTIVPTTDVTLYAIWENSDVQVTLTYNANGGSGNTPPDFSGDAGDPIVIAGNTASSPLTRDGFTFQGWNTKADGSGDPFAPGVTLNLSENTTLFAVWQPIPVVPPDSPINIDLEPGQPIGGAEVDYVIPNQTPVPNCDPTNDPSSAWSLTVNPVDPPGAAYEIDAGCTPPDGDVFGTAVLPQDVPGGIYEVVYESTSGEKIIRYFVVGPDGTFVGQSNVDPRIAKTGAMNGSIQPVFLSTLTLLLIAGATMVFAARRTQKRAV